MSKCKRKIVWHGKVEEVVVDEHAYAWSGTIPCTGILRCIHCGKEKRKK